MKIKYKAILLFLTFISCGTAQKINTKEVNTKEIFRHVNLNYGNKILLGEKLEKVKNLTFTKETTVYVKESLFGFVESIQLVFDENNKLLEIIFEYNKSKSKDKLIDSYSEDLGKPKVGVNKVFWEDKNTRFEILYNSESGKIYSKMIDI